MEEENIKVAQEKNDDLLSFKKEVKRERLNQSTRQSEEKKRRRKISQIRVIIGLIFLVLGIVAIFLTIYCRNIFGEKIGDAVLGKGVENGWVAIAASFSEGSRRVFLSLIIISVAIILTYIVNLIIKLTTIKGKKAQTIGSLIRSCIRYLAILVSGAFILYVWGVDVAAIVTGLGVLTLIIGLGCQSLISDIVSGLFIVFDDYFDVGDMVIVDGFRGYVQSIGLRTTKINDQTGNLKAITNSSITTCVNLSRYPNLICISVDMSYNEDLKHVEATLIRELPKIAKRLPQISDGPYYKGVDGVNDSSVSLLFTCSCPASYRFQVARDLRRELFLVMQENEIIIPYNQIVINQPDPTSRKKASKEDKELSRLANEQNSALPEEPKEKNALERVKEEIAKDDEKA